MSAAGESVSDSDAPAGEAPEQVAIGCLESQLQLLAALSQAFAASLDVEETLRQAVRHIMRHLRAEAASLFLLEGGELVCHACAGPVNIVGLRLSVAHGIVGRAVRENATRLVRDAGLEPDFAADVDHDTGFVTRSILCAPLTVKGERIGALEIINRDQGDGLFDDNDAYLLEVLAAAASLVIHNARMAAELVEQERLQRELELARQIQTGLLPAARAADFPLHGVSLPAREVSGDFYDYFDRLDGTIGFTIGDVSGKGMNAALLMARTSSLLRCLGKGGMEPGVLLSRVNEELCESATLGMFVTVVAGVLDPVRGRVRLANAGHLPPLYRDRQGNFQTFPASAPPLGILPGLRTETLELDLDGGSLILMTDGLTEAPGAAGGALGLAGVQSLLEALAERPAAERLAGLLAALDRSAVDRRDDVTVLIVEGQPPGSPVPLLELRCAARAEELVRLRERVAAALTRTPVPAAERPRLVLAVHEAASNIIRHAYHDDPEGEMVLRILDNGDGVEFRLRDYAPPVDPAAIRPRALDRLRPGGLGTHFIRAIMDQVRFERPEAGPGNLLVMKRTYVPAAASPAPSDRLIPSPTEPASTSPGGSAAVLGPGAEPTGVRVDPAERPYDHGDGRRPER